MTAPTPSPPPADEGRGRGFVARHLLALVVLVLAAVFIVENRHQVRIRALVPEVTAPLWEVLVATLVAGMLILLLVQRRRQRR